MAALRASRWLLLSLFAGTSISAPAWAERQEIAPLGAVRVVSPQDGAALRASGELLLAWEPGPGFDQLKQVEEWEVFLSLDGGQSFSIRLTPHLDGDLRQVRVTLPEIAAPDARLLWRLGDERREWEMLWPGRISIAPAVVARMPIRSSRFAPGERPRPAASPVHLWVEGNRRGGEWTEVVHQGAAPRLDAGSSRWRALGYPRVGHLPRAPRRVRPAPVAIAPSASLSALSVTGTRPRLDHVAAFASGNEIRRRTCRANE